MNNPTPNEVKWKNKMNDFPFRVYAVKTKHE